MAKRTIIFGDIHGCYEEWQLLLNKVGACKRDQIITVGDLCCKGPSTRKTLDLAMSLPNLKCVMGNHDWFMYQRWKAGTLTFVDEPYHRAAAQEMGSDIGRYMKFISKWPLFLDLKECIVIHAGLRPDIPLKKQHPEDLMKLRKIDDQPWYHFYTGSKLIVHGHWAKQGLVVRDNVIGLDTGCVYGRELTCVILPERKIVTVRAKKTYCPV